MGSTFVLLIMYANQELVLVLVMELVILTVFHFRKIQLVLIILHLIKKLLALYFIITRLVQIQDVYSTLVQMVLVQLMLK
jgi:hypothetical protein